MHSDTYTVTTDQFQGPLDVLLNLIEQRKLFINDISLAQVTDDFIHYVNQRQSFPVSQAAHFIYIASTLLLIKSKSLLPNLELTKEEQGSIEDLQQRLELHQRMKAAAQSIKERFGARPCYGRRTLAQAEETSFFAPDPNLSTAALHASAREILSELPQPERHQQAVVEHVVSLEETIGRLTERVQHNMRIKFSEFAGYAQSPKEKVEVIVSFLAVLELAKQNIITVEQPDRFQEIELESQTVGLPQYGTQI
jgi:segregation and condensation protein A